MYGLTSIVCSMMVAASPVIEDAPSHREMAYIPSAMPEEMGAPLSPPLAEGVEISEAIHEPQINIEIQEVEATMPLAEASAPRAEPALVLQVGEIAEEPPLEVQSNISTSPVVALPAKPVAETASMPVIELPVEKEAHINLAEVFSGAPFIYSMLLLMSLFALTLWMYHLLLMRKERLMPSAFANSVESSLAVGNWQEALALCRKEDNLLAILVRASISARHEGSQAMIERMQAEGKRATSFFWQRLSLLNDIALIAPMIGLLGTVLGMFYAFYDVNRSLESMYTLFDGLGISVGTTVAGLMVAIMALIFHSTLKYGLVRQLSIVEAKAQKIALHPTPRQSNVQTRESHELST